MIFLRSLIFSTIQSITIIIFALVEIVLWSLPLHFKWSYKLARAWATLDLWLLKLICGISYEIEGKENIPDKPCIIMCKHQSAWETISLILIFPQQVWVLKRELLQIPFLGWGLATLNPISIDRNAGRKALKQLIKQGIERLQSGSFVVIFPEGTRVPVGEMGRFGIGGAKLAVEAKANVIPVAHNAGTVWPKNSFIKYPGKIKLVIGEPIIVQDKTTAEVNKQAYQWIENKMSQLDEL